MKIFIDYKPFDVKKVFYSSHDELPPTPTASGAQLLSVIGRDSGYHLWLEADGGGVDTYVEPMEPCFLKEGQRFYAVSACIIGA